MKNALSSLAFSTPAKRSRVPRFPVLRFYPCSMVPCFPVSRFPFSRFSAPDSSLPAHAKQEYRTAKKKLVVNTTGNQCKQQVSSVALRLPVTTVDNTCCVATVVLG